MSQARKIRRISPRDAHESSPLSRFYSKQNRTRNRRRIHTTEDQDDLPVPAQDDFAIDNALQTTLPPRLNFRSSRRPHFVFGSIAISAAMTILMVGVYTSIAPTVWQDGLTSMMNDVSVLGGISLSESSMSARADPGPLLSDSNTIVAEATGALTQVSLVAPVILHKTGFVPVVTNDAPSGGFPVGTTIVTWTATDAAGNSATISQNVRIVDTTPPTIIAPQDGVHYVDEDTEFSVVPLGSPDVSDIADASPVVTNDAP
ncbi:MAG TPA: HYR domain-containing protein, partial [Nitrososphaera sp.]